MNALANRFAEPSGDTSKYYSDEVAEDRAILADIGSGSEGLRGRFADLTIGGKLNFVAFANVAAVVLCLVATVVGGWVALEVRDERVALSKMLSLSADLKSDVDGALLEGHRFIARGETAALDAAFDHVSAAERDLDALAETMLTRVPEQRASIDKIRDGIQTLRNDLERSRSAGTMGEQAILSDLLIDNGTVFSTLTFDLKQDLIARGEASDTAGRTAILWLFVAFFAVAVIGVAIILVSTRIIASDVSGTISDLTDASERLATGDTSIQIPGRERRDELGGLARSLQVFLRTAFRLEKVAQEKEALQAERSQSLRNLASRFETTVGDVVHSVAAASAQLNTTATDMAEAAAGSTRQSEAVSESMTRASQGVTAAAAASDEFAMSIGEISRQASHSSQLARKASADAQSADATIAALSSSANQVGAIVELIQSIAQRTNLLALNASIEAARGGEAGRGFAVVASEVKELAAQTSRATEDVAEQIRSMQDSTSASVSALRSIGDQIKQLESTAVSIASAVDQQSVAGQDLARSIDLAARSTDEVAESIAGVRGASTATGEAAGQVLGSAKSLETQAGALRRQVDEFLQHVTAS